MLNFTPTYRYIFDLSHDCDSGSWLAVFTHGMRGLEEYVEAEAKGETAPLAICRAALKAIEISGQLACLPSQKPIIIPSRMEEAIIGK
jgi:hypothetical protein